MTENKNKERYDVVDVTERVQLEEAIRRVNDLYLTVERKYGYINCLTDAVRDAQDALALMARLLNEIPDS